MKNELEIAFPIYAESKVRESHAKNDSFKPYEYHCAFGLNNGRPI